MSYDEPVGNPDLAAYARMNSDDVYRMLTGADPHDLREMVRAVGGTTAAVQILAAAGISRTRRTIERWVTTRGTQRISRPRADAMQALRNAAQQARLTQAGRRQILTRRRERNLRGHGMRMRGPAKMGPLIGDVEYRRRRYLNHHVSGSVLDRTVDAYLQGGEEDAYGAFNAAFGAEYGVTGHGPDEAEWIIEDMSGLDFDIHRGD